MNWVRPLAVGKGPELRLNESKKRVHITWSHSSYYHGIELDDFLTRSGFHFNYTPWMFRLTKKFEQRNGVNFMTFPQFSIRKFYWGYKIFADWVRTSDFVGKWTKLAVAFDGVLDKPLAYVELLEVSVGIYAMSCRHFVSLSSNLLFFRSARDDRFTC